MGNRGTNSTTTACKRLEILTPIGFIVLYIIAAAVGLCITYLVIRAAVMNALISHYKTVRLYEATGNWEPGPHGTGEPIVIPGKA